MTLPQWPSHQNDNLSGGEDRGLIAALRRMDAALAEQKVAVDTQRGKVSELHGAVLGLRRSLVALNDITGAICIGDLGAKSMRLVRIMNAAG